MTIGDVGTPLASLRPAPAPCLYPVPQHAPSSSLSLSSSSPSFHHPPLLLPTNTSTLLSARRHRRTRGANRPSAEGAGRSPRPPPRVTCTPLPTSAVTRQAATTAPPRCNKRSRLRTRSLPQASSSAIRPTMPVPLSTWAAASTSSRSLSTSAVGAGGCGSAAGRSEPRRPFPRTRTSSPLTAGRTRPLRIFSSTVYSAVAGST